MQVEVAVAISVTGVAAATFSVSGVEYHNTLPAFSSNYDIKSFKMIAGGL